MHLFMFVGFIFLVVINIKLASPVFLKTCKKRRDGSLPTQMRAISLIQRIVFDTKDSNNGSILFANRFLHNRN